MNQANAKQRCELHVSDSVSDILVTPLMLHDLFQQEPFVSTACHIETMIVIVADDDHDDDGGGDA